MLQRSPLPCVRIHFDVLLQIAIACKPFNPLLQGSICSRLVLQIERKSWRAYMSGFPMRALKPGCCHLPTPCQFAIYELLHAFTLQLFRFYLHFISLREGGKQGRHAIDSSHARLINGTLDTPEMRRLSKEFVCASLSFLSSKAWR